VDELAKRVKALEARVAELEELRWVEGDAASLVQDKLWERVSSCNLADCYSRDPVLRAFSDIPVDLRAGYAILLLTNGQWTAKQVSGGLWLVEASVGEDKPRRFNAHEWNGAVVAEIPPAE
jgi:hypothetical protein